MRRAKAAIVVVIVKIEQFVLMNLPYAPAWKIQDVLHKKNKIQSRLIIESALISTVFLSLTWVYLSIFILQTNTGINIILQKTKKIKQKPLSHPFCKLLIVTVIVAASSWQSHNCLRKIHLTAQDPKSHNEFVLDTSLMTIILMIVNTLSYQITSVLQSSPSFPFN